MDEKGKIKEVKASKADEKIQTIKPEYEKFFIEGALDLPKEFSVEYFVNLYFTGKHSQSKILLGMISILKTVNRVDLWNGHLKDTPIFASINGYNSSYDCLFKSGNHALNGSVELAGMDSKRIHVYRITAKGMDNVKDIFPDIYKYLTKKES